MPDTDSRFVEVYRACHALQAHAIKLALEENGIPVIIENEALQDGIGDLPAGWATAPRILVEETQVSEARAVIEQTDHSRQSSSRLTTKETAVALSAATLGLLGAAMVCDSSPSAESPETDRCLACHATMAESDDVCPNCGWTYETEVEAEVEPWEE